MSDGIVLLGLPGSGKSVVGRCLAERLGRRFVDLDDEIRQRTGRSPADIIGRDGEPAFRVLERDAVVAACSIPGAVVATGGGASLDPLNRWAFMVHGRRVRLDAPPDVIASRLARDPTDRPLLGGDVVAGLRRTADERSAIYAAADVAVDATGDVVAVTDAVLTALARDDGLFDGWRVLYQREFDRRHPVGPSRGQLLMGYGFDRDAFGVALAAFGDRMPAVIADRRALRAEPRLDRALPDERRLLVEGGESAKRFDRLGKVLQWLTAEGVERGDPLVAAGGGSIGDLAGLAAALHRRGMPLVQLPTTWLAQADSAHGGKVAIDLPGAKNGVGTFWPPWAVLSDIRLLDGLARPRLRDGLAECLKAGFIGDADLWRLVEQRGRAALTGDDRAARYAITERAVRVKLAIVDRDPYETGERRVLNLGHTLGHALEIESRYRLAHGAAVALGLRAVAAIAARRGAEPGLAERIDAVLRRLGFPLARRFDPVAVGEALTTDKKRERGAQRWLLPMAVGRVDEVSDVTPAELRLALATIQAP